MTKNNLNWLSEIFVYTKFYRFHWIFLIFSLCLGKVSQREKNEPSKYHLYMWFLIYWCIYLSKLSLLSTHFEFKISISIYIVYIITFLDIYIFFLILWLTISKFNVINFIILFLKMFEWVKLLIPHCILHLIIILFL